MNAKASKVLLIVTSHSQLGTSGERTGFWLEELAAPYRAFVTAGAQVDIASPLGGKAPADPRSTQEPSEAVRAFQAAAPFPNPPAVLRDKDGMISFNFGFYFEIGKKSNIFRSL